MRFAYFYFMKPEPERVPTVGPDDAVYRQAFALEDYRGGPFADRSGGMILFETESREEAEQLVVNDPSGSSSATRSASRSRSRSGKPRRRWNQCEREEVER